MHIEYVQNEYLNLKLCAVYSIALNAPGSEGAYIATSMTTLVCGVPNLSYSVPVPFPAVPGSADDLDLNKNNKCMLNGIAGPDNVHYVPGHDALLIGVFQYLCEHCRSSTCVIRFHRCNKRVIPPRSSDEHSDCFYISLSIILGHLYFP